MQEATDVLAMGIDPYDEDELTDLSDPDDHIPKKSLTESGQRRLNKKKEAKKLKKATFLPNGDVSPEKLKRIEKEIQPMINEAEINSSNYSKFFFSFYIELICMPATFAFNFKQVAKYGKRKLPPCPKTIVTWDDNVPRMAWSTDNYKMAFYLPHANPAGSVVSQLILLFFTMPSDSDLLLGYYHRGHF
jgi:hypothetical protein